MAEQSVAQPPRTTTREDRARDLAERHFHEIAASKDGHEYLALSCTGARDYRVHYDPAGGSWCECPDHEIRDAVCKHILAVAIVAAELHRKGGRFTRPSDLEEIAEITGIAYSDLSSAFTGERKNMCLDAAIAAVDADPEGGPEAWGESIRSWAKKRGVGRYDRRLIDQPAPTYDGEPLQDV
jgi:hypothetical protein